MLFSLLTGLPSLITGLFGTLNGITAALSNAKIAQIEATTEQARIEATAMVDTLQARRDVMIAESAHSKLNIIVRAIIAIGPAAILLKIFLWDKVVGSFDGCAGRAGSAVHCVTFNTDPLDDNLWQVVMVVLGFYFLTEASTTVARIFKAR